MMTTLNTLTIIFSLAIPLSCFYLMSKFSFFNKRMANDIPGKYAYLDPLRGLAAICVFIHHSVMVYNQHVMGSFGPYGIFTYESINIRKVYIYFGQASVMAFFVITGFLFFGKLINAENQLNVRAFYESRIRRLVPAMFSCLFIYLFVCYSLRDESHHAELSTYIVSWFSFGFIGIPKLSDSIPGWSVTAGILWTLVLEWKFYLLIPFLSYLIVSKKTAVVFLFSSVALILYLLYIKNINEKDASIYLCFLSGLAISLIHKYCAKFTEGWIKHPLTALFCLAFFYYTFSLNTESYNLQVTVSIFFSLLIVTSGNSFFGVLKNASLHWAGKCSYSIYIMHAILMHTVFPMLHLESGYYVSYTIASILLCLASMLNYIYVERRYMQASYPASVVYGK